MSSPLIPRNPLGEWGYRGLWIAIVALPAVVALIRYVGLERGVVWFVFFVVGVPALVVAQAVLAMLAWVYRQRQWRHWLGSATSVASFVYYGLWVLLALSLPDGAPGEKFPAPFERELGGWAGDPLATWLIWLTLLAYIATLGGIIVEGEKAVASDPSGRTVKSIIQGLFRERVADLREK